MIGHVDITLCVKCHARGPTNCPGPLPREPNRASGFQHPILLGHSVGGAIATFVATLVDAADLILLDGTVGDRAFTKNAANCIPP